MENNCGIYMFEVVGGNPNRVGEKYIGQTVNFKNRKKEHLGDLKRNNHNNKKLQRYYNKYGEQSLAPSLFFKGEKDLNFWEKFFIKIFDCRGEGFNHTDGGDYPPYIKKPCSFQNVWDNRIENFDCILDFCEKYGFSDSAVSGVLLGKYRFIGDWFSPANKWRPTIYEVISPAGEIKRVFRVNKFCRENQINDFETFRMVLKRKRHSSQGWKLLNGIEKKDPNRLKYIHFKIINQDGNIYEGNNMSKCARELNINHKNLHKLIHGKRLTCGGWRLFKEENL